MNIGGRIRELRKIKKLKLTELAQKSYISQSFLSDIENNHTKPSLDTLFAICNSLDISPAMFFSVFPEADVEEQLYLIDYISNDIKEMIGLITKLPDNERKALINFLSERLNNN
ncbi:helix-turn-helix domain-containing protein [Robertmurraya massiliosenegalensis]|uniref:helix-turn-helix domain-containing protein n=1 Tax=Robertmurraya massiliosenegalensis TaxID=1287657 RepID=UPI00031E9FAD|nr:helix-turn-helix domain-containing protein [Robertmurraya massiliosenegalensis]